MTENVGDEMYEWAKDLFPICRSLTGDGVRETLVYIQKLLPELVIHEVPSGTKAFDWIVPDEWNITDAYIADASGNRIVDFQTSNLHVVGYSEPIDRVMSLDELAPHLFTMPEQPDAVPYITSYYKRFWGFCLTENQRRAMPPGNYHVVIDSTLAQGHLTYGELLIPGKTEKEVFLSTYVCHPSLANNELSGPVVTAALARWIMQQPNKYYSYRVLFTVETLGAIVYLSRNLKQMKKNIAAGFILTCVGDDRNYSFVASRDSNTLADRVAHHVLDGMASNPIKYTYLERGSDERQYCSPGVDLPVVSLMRTRYGNFPEYHSSLDDLSLISPKGLFGGFDINRRCLEMLEQNRTYKMTTLAEPQLGKRNLYPQLSTKDSAKSVTNLMNFIAYCDGQSDLLEIAKRINVQYEEVFEIAQKLNRAGLLEVVS